MTKQNLFRIILNGLIFSLSLVFWLFLKDSLASQLSWSVRIISPLVLFMILEMFWGIYLLTETKKIYLWWISFLFIISFVFIFSREFFMMSISSLTGLAILLLTFIFLVIGAYRTRNEKDKRYKISPVDILRRGFGPMMTAMALLAALVFYWSSDNKIEDRDLLLPRVVFNQISQPIINVLGGQNLGGLTEEGQKNLNAAQDQVYDSVNFQINTLSVPYKKYIPAGLALTFFFTLKFFGFLIIWPVIFLCWILYRILLGLGIFKITKIEVEKEIIEI